MGITRNHILLRVVGYLCAISTLLIVAASSSGPQEHGVPQTLRGAWVLESIYKTHNVQGINPKQQHALLHSKIIFSQNAVSSCGQSVPVGESLVQEISRKIFFENTHVNFEELSVKGALITEVVLNGDSAGDCDGTYTVPGQDVFLLGSDYLIVDFEGVFYRAKRAES